MRLNDEVRTQLRAMLDAHIRARYGTQAAAARAWGVSQPFVVHVLTGKALPTDQMMDDAGIELVAVYKRPGR